MSDHPPDSRPPYTAATRRALLDEFFQLMTVGIGDEAADTRRGELWDAYIDGTPRVPVARCPFTGELFDPPLDTFGLDGLFWKHDPPARAPERMTATRIAFTGAVALTESVEAAPFLAKPGPGAPFVVPRILRHPDIRAVLSAISIGTHTGYAITYFANRPLAECERFNTWGTDDYQLDLGEGDYGWNRSEPTMEDYDFELAPWIQQGKLLWIAPGDVTCGLHEGLVGCPYLSLAGHRTPVCIQDGEVWDAYVSSSASADDDEMEEAALDASFPCPACQGANEPNAKFCCECGASLAPPATCRSCDAPLKPGSRFCSNCGARQT